MLKELSLRNAKRQFKEYALYFVTLTCTISFMYAFNTLIFSDSVKTLSSLEILPYMIIAASLLIVLVMGWIISYMTSYMLKKRSREFSIYMVSGIPNHIISRLIFHENILIGLLAFLLGIPVGMLLSQLLEAVVLYMFGMKYMLHFRLSLSTVGLTFLYFSLMLLYSLWKNKKWIHKLKLYDLLLLDRQNEKKPLSGNAYAIGIFCLSMFLGSVGLLLLYAQPIGKGYDVLAGTILLVLFLFGFFLSVPTFLVTRMGDCTAWKYRKNRLVSFRGFTAKIYSASITMGILSILFMLAIAFLGIGTTINTIANRNVELSVFDIMILHNEEWKDFSSYDNMLRRSFSIQKSYSYAIYTDTKKDFLTVRNHTVIDMGRSGGSSYAEFQYDTYIKQSDYIKLREILGYETVELNPLSCYIHCVPALKKNFTIYLKEQGNKLDCAGYSFAASEVFSEPFSQMEAYGNGLDYVIIVPDRAAEEMKVLYSLYTAITESPFSSNDIQKITESCESLARLDNSIGRSVPDSNTYTALIDNIDYFSGKWVVKESISQLYAMVICLFYLAFILEIMGAAILATQVLSDREKKQKQDCILWQLGMSRQLINRLNNQQLSLLFLLPVLPALIVASGFVYVSAWKIQLSAFHLPVFTNNFWIVQSFGVSAIFFLLLYSVYYIAARISYGQQSKH